MTMESKIENKIEHISRREPNGFGYEVMKKVMEGSKVVKREIVFHTSDREQANDYARMKNMGVSENTIFIPKTEWETRVLKFEEKHGDRFFLVKTISDFHKVCKKIFDEREKYGWYNYIKALKEPKAPDFKEDDIPNLPESMQQSAKDLMRRYKTDLHEYKSSLLQKNLYDLAKTGNEAACAQFLNDSKSGEYESFEFIEPDTY
jgi:hypothetical protein